MRGARAACAARPGWRCARPPPRTRPSPAAGGRRARCRSLACSGIAYAIAPPGMRTFTAPSSSRSRLTVACVATTPSAASISTSCAWLEIACSSSSRAMRCCRCGLPSVAISVSRPPVRHDASDSEHAPRAACMRFAACCQTTRPRARRSPTPRPPRRGARAGSGGTTPAPPPPPSARRRRCSPANAARRAAGSVLLPHRRPHVGVDRVGAAHRLVRVGHELDGAAEVAGPLDDVSSSSS